MFQSISVQYQMWAMCVQLFNPNAGTIVLWHTYSCVLITYWMELKRLHSQLLAQGTKKN